MLVAQQVVKLFDEIVRLLRALRSACLFLQEQRGYAVGLFEKNLRFDRYTKDVNVDASNNGSICLMTRVRLLLQVSAYRLVWR